MFSACRIPWLNVDIPKQTSLEWGMHLTDYSRPVLTCHHTIETSLTIKIARTCHTWIESLEISKPKTFACHSWWRREPSYLDDSSRKSLCRNVSPLETPRIESIEISKQKRLHVTHVDAANRVISTTQAEISLLMTPWIESFKQFKPESLLASDATTRVFSTVQVGTSLCHLWRRRGPSSFNNPSQNISASPLMSRRREPNPLIAITHKPQDACIRFYCWSRFSAISVANSWFVVRKMIIPRATQKPQIRIAQSSCIHQIESVSCNTIQDQKDIVWETDRVNFPRIRNDWKKSHS